MLLGLITLCPSSSLKARLYRLLGADIGKNIYFAPDVVISCGDMNKVKLGDSSSFGLGTKVLCENIVVGKRVRMGGDCNIRGDGHIVIGDDVFVGVGCILDCNGELLIDDGVQIAPGARILTHDTSGNYYCKEPIPFQRTWIMARAYIGAGAIVLPGVSVGCEAIVGAGAVVTKNVQAGDTVVGVPARPVKKEMVEGNVRRQNEA